MDGRGDPRVRRSYGTIDHERDLHRVGLDGMSSEVPLFAPSKAIADSRYSPSQSRDFNRSAACSPCSPPASTSPPDEIQEVKSWAIRTRRVTSLVCAVVAVVAFTIGTAKLRASYVGDHHGDHVYRYNMDEMSLSNGKQSRTIAIEPASAAIVPPDSREEKASSVFISPPVSTLSFSATNFYHERDGKSAQGYPWLRDGKLVEPHRETTLRVVDPREGHEYSWEVQATRREAEEGKTQAVAVGTGAEVVHVFTHADENLVILLERTREGLLTRRVEEAVVVKYVRREIRTLTDEDREELLDAMYQLWETEGNSSEDRKLYGDTYVDIWAISNLHFSASSRATCDHFHDGLGFLTSHTQLSNVFEHSLQLVNPRVTLPYWDFTIETSEGFKKQVGVDPEEPQGSSPILSSAWFGGSDPHDHQVKDGRWAFTKVPDVRDGEIGDAFMRLRAPWSVNIRPHITRGLGEMCGVRSQVEFPWPTCRMHYDLLTDNFDFYDWVWNAQYDPHGTVHVWMGGILDCQGAYAEINSLVGEAIGAKFASMAFIHRKDLFRDGLFTCRTPPSETRGASGFHTSAGARAGEDHLKPRTSRTAAANTKEVPTCGCLDYDLEHGDDYKTILDFILFGKKLLNGFDESTIREVVSIVCGATISDGDHVQASSPLDPTFWMLHPTMERLWMFKRLTGTLTDLRWPDRDTTVVTPRGITRNEIVSLYNDQCVGHRGSDVFPFGLAGDLTDIAVQTGISSRDRGSAGDDQTSGDENHRRSERVGTVGAGLPNREVLQALDPRRDDLPYVYDTFRWDHCQEDGFNFEDTWDATDAADSSAAGGDRNRDIFSGFVPLSLRPIQNERKRGRWSPADSSAE